MIKLAKGRDNSVMLKVSVAESLESFSANLMICGTVKKIEGLSESGDKIFFTSSEIDATLAVIGEEHYGVLLISDSGGTCRLKAQPQVMIVDVGDSAIPASDQLICCSLPDKMVIAPERGESYGGDTPDLSNYVTKTGLNNAKAEVKQYTDSKVGTIATQVDKQGEAVQKTAGDLEEVKETVSEIAARYMSAEVKDEDNDGKPDAETLYINKGMR